MSDVPLIVGPDGKPPLRHIELTVQDAMVLRAYKRLLEKYALKEALYCSNCWDRDLSDGCKAFVRHEAIMIQCRCSERTFEGPTL